MLGRLQANRHLRSHPDFCLRLAQRHCSKVMIPSIELCQELPTYLVFLYFPVHNNLSNVRIMRLEKPLSSVAENSTLSTLLHPAITLAKQLTTDKTLFQSRTKYYDIYSTCFIYIPPLVSFRNFTGNKNHNENHSIY